MIVFEILVNDVYIIWHTQKYQSEKKKNWDVWTFLYAKCEKDMHIDYDRKNIIQEASSSHWKPQMHFNNNNK